MSAGEGPGRQPRIPSTAPAPTASISPGRQRGGTRTRGGRGAHAAHARGAQHVVAVPAVRALGA